MADLSVHGLVIALLQFGFVLGLAWLQAVLRRRRLRAGAPDHWVTVGLVVALLVEYAVLRVQPVRMGAGWFEYTLGLFDAFTLSGLFLLVVLHRVHRPSVA